MLFNEFLKEREKAEDRRETIAQLKSDATKQEAVSIELKATVAQQQKAMDVEDCGTDQKSELTLRIWRIPLTGVQLAPAMFFNRS